MCGWVGNMAFTSFPQISTKSKLQSQRSSCAKWIPYLDVTMNYQGNISCFKSYELDFKTARNYEISHE